MKTLLIALTLLVSSSAFAAPSSVITQILADPEVVKATTGTSILKIEQTAQARCIGCYEITLTLQTPVGTQLVVVTTEAIGADKVAVKIVSRTR